jgi:hypothetical protein
VNKKAFADEIRHRRAWIVAADDLCRDCEQLTTTPADASLEAGRHWRRAAKLYGMAAEHYRRVSPLARAAGIRIFNGGYTFHEELLSRAAQRHPELRLRAFDTADFIADVRGIPREEVYAATTENFGRLFGKAGGVVSGLF